VSRTSSTKSGLSNAESWSTFGGPYRRIESSVALLVHVYQQAAQQKEVGRERLATSRSVNLDQKNCSFPHSSSHPIHGIGQRRNSFPPSRPISRGYPTGVTDNLVVSFLPAPFRRSFTPSDPTVLKNMPGSGRRKSKNGYSGGSES
jgi:hypothetical protein